MIFFFPTSLILLICVHWLDTPGFNLLNKEFCLKTYKSIYLNCFFFITLRKLITKFSEMQQLSLGFFFLKMWISFCEEMLRSVIFPGFEQFDLCNQSGLCWQRFHILNILHFILSFASGPLQKYEIFFAFLHYEGRTAYLRQDMIFFSSFFISWLNDSLWNRIIAIHLFHSFQYTQITKIIKGCCVNQELILISPNFRYMIM